MRITYFIFLALIISSCAQTSVLTGGKTDTTAPVLDSAKTFPLNGATNFTGDEIVLAFEEYIILKNPSENILITPQPRNKPTISAKNKKFRLKFNETLEPNTTYSISFNRAIADYTENNDSLFQYVFSTGSFIDSLKINGQIKDAYTNQPVKDAIIGLYPVSDTIDYTRVPLQIKPTYLTLSNNEGLYEINYIKNGNYHLFAFTDIDRDLKFNPNSERIAFIENQVISIDSNLSELNFRMYTPLDTTVKLVTSSLYYPGKVELVFSNEPSQPYLSYSSPLLMEKTDRRDSLIYWMTGRYSKSVPFVLNYGEKTDSLKLIMKDIPKEANIKALEYTTNFDVNKLLPYDTLTLTFDEPIESFNKDLIRVMDADSVLINFEANIKNVRSIQIYSPDQADHYVSIDSGAIKSYLSPRTNTNISLDYTYHEPKYLGQLILQLEIQETTNGIIELLDKGGKRLQSIPVNNVNDPIIFTKLKPGNYQLRYIDDVNNDQKWTPGDLNNHIQPEKVFYYESSIKVRSNWDMEIDWKFGNTE